METKWLEDFASLAETRTGLAATAALRGPADFLAVADATCFLAGA